MQRLLPLSLLLFSFPVVAQPSSGVPGLLDLQGQLRTENGQPVNKTVSLKVSLYDASTGGNLLYSEEMALVPVVGGRFSVHVGASSPLPADVFVTRSMVFVGISVDGSPELPRQQLVPVAYAFKSGYAARAASAETAVGLDCQGCVTGIRIADDAVTGNKIADGSIGTSELSDSAVTASKLGEPCAQGEILKRKPGGWGCATDEDSQYSGADFAISNQVCGSGQLAKGFGPDGLLLCAKDEGTTYLAGNGLSLDGTTFAIKFDVTDARYVNEAQANAVTSLMIVDGTVGTDDLAADAVTTSKVADGAVTAAKLGEACTVGEILKKTDAGWACGVDGGNTYSGADFALSGQTCAAGTVAKGIDADGTLVCVTDETGKIVAGPGLVLDGSKLSLPLTCATGNVLKWNGTTAAWECEVDLNAQYAAGLGLKLDAATFSVDQAVVTNWAKAACFDTNDEVLAVVATGGYLNKSDKLTESQMPPNGLDEISNGIISDQFVDSASSAAPVGIPDNNPIGVSSDIVFPDIGIAEKLTVSVDITSSNITQVDVYLYDPNNVEYVLYDVTYDPNSNATSLKTSFPDPTAPVSGNLTTWVGKNPVGTWRLKVIDRAYLNNATDGQINLWSVNIQTLSTKKIEVKGDAHFDQNVSIKGDLSITGKLTGTAGIQIQGDTTLTGKLTVNGATQITGTLTTTGVIASTTGGFKFPDGAVATSGLGAFSRTAASTCKALLQGVPDAGDGWYWIDPDGAGTGLRPFQVWCDMTGGGWIRIDVISYYPFAIHTEGERSQPFAYTLTEAQINAIRAVSTEARQDWQCQGLGVGSSYALIGWDKSAFAASGSGVCWHSDNASFVSGSGTNTTFARIPIREWRSQDCGDATEACQYNVRPAFFR